MENIKSEILSFVLSNTNRDMLETVNTRDVAKKFNLETKEAYSILNELAFETKILKLDPITQDGLSGNKAFNTNACDWVGIHTEDRDRPNSKQLNKPTSPEERDLERRYRTDMYRNKIAARMNKSEK